MFKLDLLNLKCQIQNVHFEKAALGSGSRWSNMRLVLLHTDPVGASIQHTAYMPVLTCLEQIFLLAWQLRGVVLDVRFRRRRFRYECVLPGSG